MPDKSDDIKQLFSHLGLNPNDYQEIRSAPLSNATASEAPRRWSLLQAISPPAPVPLAPAAVAAPVAIAPVLVPNIPAPAMPAWPDSSLLSVPRLASSYSAPFAPAATLGDLQSLFQSVKEPQTVGVEHLIEAFQSPPPPPPPVAAPAVPEQPTDRLYRELLNHPAMLQAPSSLTIGAPAFAAEQPETRYAEDTPPPAGPRFAAPLKLAASLLTGMAPAAPAAVAATPPVMPPPPTQPVPAAPALVMPKQAALAAIRLPPPAPPAAPRRVPPVAPVIRPAERPVERPVERGAGLQDAFRRLAEPESPKPAGSGKLRFNYRAAQAATPAAHDERLDDVFRRISGHNTASK